MEDFVADIVRSVVTATMYAVLLTTLGEPKYRKRYIYIAISIIIALDVFTSILFYLYGDLTVLAQFDILFYFIMSFAMKPLFKDTVMQWVFNFLTAMNVFAAIMVISYLAVPYMPFDDYLVSLARLILFAVVILLFRKLRPLYRQTVKQWRIFAFVVFAIFLYFVYFIVSSDSITEAMDEEAGTLLIFILLGTAVYVCIFYSLQKIASEYLLKEENLKMQNSRDIMNISIHSMESRLRMMDEMEQQNNVALHDRRHFNNMLLELLRSGKTDEAIKTLNRQVSSSPETIKTYCENTTVNAAISYYGALMEYNNFDFITDLDIPEDLSIDSMELAIVLSNLLENAVHACEKMSVTSEKYIRFTAIYTGQLLIEVENPYDGIIKTDENGYPESDVAGHGVGTKSVIAFAETYGSLIEYNFNDGKFLVRMIIGY